MTLVPRCGVCDAPLKPWTARVRCDRCYEDCPTCGGDVAHCHHPLPAERLTETRGDPFLKVAAE